MAIQQQQVQNPAWVVCHACFSPFKPSTRFQNLDLQSNMSSHCWLSEWSWSLHCDTANETASKHFDMACVCLSKKLVSQYGFVLLCHVKRQSFSFSLVASSVLLLLRATNKPRPKTSLHVPDRIPQRAAVGKLAERNPTQLLAPYLSVYKATV